MNRLTCIFIGAVMLVACDTVNKPVPEQQSLLEASKQELAAALGERDEMLALMREISTATEQIRQMENILSMVNGQPEKPSQRERILSDIAAIRKTLQQRREQLAELEKRLGESKLFSEEMQASLDVMKRQLDSRTVEVDRLRAQLGRANETIGELTIRVDSLSNTVDDVSRMLTASQVEAADLENELNLCYYVIASKEELKKHKILETGFLRKTRLLKGDFDKNFFTVGDKRLTDTLMLDEPKVKLLTNHPEDSYELIDSGGVRVLHIKSPDRFWDYSNYLVIQND